jgi:hypothetical protein
MASTPAAGPQETASRATHTTQSYLSPPPSRRSFSMWSRASLPLEWPASSASALSHCTQLPIVEKSRTPPLPMSREAPEYWSRLPKKCSSSNCFTRSWSRRTTDKPFCQPGPLPLDTAHSGSIAVTALEVPLRLARVSHGGGGPRSLPALRVGGERGGDDAMHPLPDRAPRLPPDRKMPRYRRGWSRRHLRLPRPGAEQ